MQPKDFIALALAVVGGIGLCFMATAFGLIAWRGGWELAITKPAAEKLWPTQRWLMLAGATGGVVMGLGWLMLSLATRGNVFGGP